MTLPRISVALCTYNGERYLKEQLDSMLIQTRLPDELVVCDDGSKDATLDILEDFRKTAPFQVHIVRNEQNLRMARNFEKCIGLCSGDFIAPTDFDDAWYPNKLELLCTGLQAHRDAAYVIADADLMDEFSKPVKGSLYQGAAFRLIPMPAFPFEIREDTLMRVNVVWGSSMMMRAEMRSMVLPLPQGWYQDSGIAMLSCFAGSYGVAMAARLMRYRIHPTQAAGILPPNWKIKKMLRQLRSTYSAIWGKELALYSALKDHVYSNPELYSRSSQAILQLLDRKIAHLERRNLARASGIPKRWSMAIRELLDGNYHQLSNSWYSFARDIFL